MASAAQIGPNELASDWVVKAMESADLNITELSRRSGVTRMTIYNVLHHSKKNGCRFDTLVMLLQACGYTFVIKPL